MDAALARRGGFSFPLRDVVEADTVNEVTVAIGGAYARLAVRVNGPTGPEAHTLEGHALAPRGPGRRRAPRAGARVPGEGHGAPRDRDRPPEWRRHPARVALGLRGGRGRG